MIFKISPASGAAHEAASYCILTVKIGTIEGGIRTMRRILAVILAAVMLLAACGIAGAEKETRKVETAPDADAFIEAFLGENPEEMDGMWAFSPQMEAALNQYGGIGGLAK
jgi:hypothetical protein